LHKTVLEAGKIVIEPEQLIEFDSAGRCLIIGAGTAVNAVLPQLASLELFCISTDEVAIESEQGVTVINQQLMRLEGWLGAFTASFTTEKLTVDLVLDLSEQALITTAVPPLGYFAPGYDQQALVEALQQLPDLVGVFDKPKFFNYNADICAHGRRGITGCSNCIDACPAGAVVSSGHDLINVNPSLCQGCGSCTVVCPSGAMSYALPTLDISINRLRTMLQSYFDSGKQAPQILIHDEANGLDLLQAYDFALADNVVPFSIEEIGALGMPFWLSALAYGAGGVLIWDAGSHDDHDWQELQDSIVQANQLVEALGYGSERIRYLLSKDFAALKQALALPVTSLNIQAAQYAGVDDKRRMITMALTHLHQQAESPMSEVKLSAGVPFGEIEVDKQACTLCMSCVSVCPMGAVLDGVDKPQLNFIEDLCVQCGMCETACPENAIDLSPRYLFERDQARQKRLLNEEPIFHCISCQKPFATQKMIDTMIGKLADHPMFQGAALERLKMCEDCRVKAMFRDS
jgi:ferredoxin